MPLLKALPPSFSDPFKSSLVICKAGANPKVDEAIRLYPMIEEFLRQDVEDATAIEDCARRMVQIMGRNR